MSESAPRNNLSFPQRMTIAKLLDDLLDDLLKIECELGRE
jgi:hypothetical protein